MFTSWSLWKKEIFSSHAKVSWLASECIRRRAEVQTVKMMNTALLFSALVNHTYVLEKYKYTHRCIIIHSVIHIWIHTNTHKYIFFLFRHATLPVVHKLRRRHLGQRDTHTHMHKALFILCDDNICCSSAAACLTYAASKHNSYTDSVSGGVGFLPVSYTSVCFL